MSKTYCRAALLSCPKSTGRLNELCLGRDVGLGDVSDVESHVSLATKTSLQGDAMDKPKQDAVPRLLGCKKRSHDASFLALLRSGNAKYYKREAGLSPATDCLGLHPANLGAGPARALAGATWHIFASEIRLDCF